MTIWETEPNPEVAARLAAQERELVRLREEVERWRRAAGAQPVRSDVEFTSVSGRAVEPVYTPLDIASAAELPGEFPFTRGIHPTMTLFPRVRQLLVEQGRTDILVTGGGIIPPEDAAALQDLGIGRLFGPGTPTSDLIGYIESWAADHLQG